MLEGIGEQLREARTVRGIELEDAERQIKIRKRFLVAMEEERWEVLPGAAYARGFLHTYAELLGLDADAIVDEYRREERERQGAEPEPVPAPVAEPPSGGARPPLSERIPRGPWVLVAAGVAAVLAFLLVLGITGGEEEGGGEGEPRPAAEQEATQATTPERERQPAPERAKLELTTTADVWVCLLDDDGAPVIEGVTVPAGESEGPFRARAFDLTLGNGQVELVANGEPVEIASPADPVGYRITADRIRELDEGERPTCA